MIARLVMVGWLVLLVVLVAHWWRQRDGRVRSGGGTPTAVGSAVLVSTPSCRTCPAVRTALADVAARADGFSWTEVDAVTDLDFVRHHGIRRAPTVLFLDRAGTVVARASGPVAREDVAATVGLSRLAAAS